MDNEPRLAQVIRKMRSEIRKLELENMGLRRVGTKLRRNATTPTLVTEYKKSIVMTVRRYSIFQSLVYHQHPADFKLTRIPKYSVTEARQTDTGQYTVPK
ncbi:hypothetical protein UPYG_G00295880 [Umbra pygmaea]|uniref:Uncharacterized protein n=1 Tax=Umbra pygmaea TaxID=75934 RepID=A0ABD0W5M4_UMBPY